MIGAYSIRTFPRLSKHAVIRNAMRTSNARLKLSLLIISSRSGQPDKLWFAIASLDNGHHERGR